MAVPFFRSRTRPREHSWASRLLGILALVGAALLLPGCSNNPYPPGETRGNVIYRRLDDDPRFLDPSVAYVITEAQIIDVIYPSFFRYHYLKRNPYVLELLLGAEMPTRKATPVTDMVAGKPQKKNGETWTFRIKKGIHFQDDDCFPGGKGREVTAKDFLYSFRRMADPRVPCPVLGFFEDKILGFADYVKNNRQNGADYDAPVPGLQLDPNDPYTFRIVLNQPYPQLRFMMAMHFTTPIPREAVELYGKEKFNRHPVGCGAYTMVEYTPKRRVVLKKNPTRVPEYYPTEGAPGDPELGRLKDAGQQLPLADTIVYSFVKESVTGWNLFLQGYMDGWGVTQQNYQQAMSRPGVLSREMIDHGIKLEHQEAPQISYFAFNMNDPVFGGYTPERRKLRQAISLALDSQQFIDLESQGNGIPAQSIIPPGLFGYDPKYKNPYRQFSVEAAKKKLAEAGYPDGIDPKTGEQLTLYFDNTATSAEERQSVGLIQKQIEAIGVRFESRVFRGPVWQDRLDKGQAQFFRYGWLADYPDPENFVFLLYGPNKRPGPNASAYQNPEYDKLFEQMRAMEDTPARAEIIRKMRDIAAEDCPWIYLIHDQDLGLRQGWVSNTKPHGVSNDTVKYWRVDGEKRAALQAQWNRPNYWPAGIGAVVLLLSALPAAVVVRGRANRRSRREIPAVRSRS